MIETYASQNAWGGVLLEELEGKEEICGYASDTFKGAELNYPSSHKELVAVKKTNFHFKLYLKPVKIPSRTDLKIFVGMLKNNNLLTDRHTRVHKLVLWLQNFDFDIVHEPEYLKCIVDMLSREAHDKNDISLFMLSNAEIIQRVIQRVRILY